MPTSTMHVMIMISGGYTVSKLKYSMESWNIPAELATQEQTRGGKGALALPFLALYVTSSFKGRAPSFLRLGGYANALVALQKQEHLFSFDSWLGRQLPPGAFTAYKNRNYFQGDTISIVINQDSNH